MTKRAHRRWPAALAGGACALALSGHALAQTTLDDPLDDHSAKRLDRMEKVLRELRAIVFQGRETGVPIVVQPADTQGQIGALSDRLTELDRGLTKMNGEMEVMRHDLDQSRQEANDLRAQVAALKQEMTGLDQKLQGQSAPPPPPPAAALEPPPVAPSDAAAAFAVARTRFLSGDTSGAETAFHDFTDQFGDTPRGPEGRYYLAKTLLARRAWSDAATADIGAIRGWPQTRWAPDAVLDLSRALVGLGKASDACQALDELDRRYPKATPGVKAGAAAMRGQAKCG